jgi:hypothetical protein
MEKKTFLEKIKEKSWLISLVLLLVIFLQTCSNSKKYTALKKDVDKLENVPTKIEMEKAIKIEGFEISKRMLYDNNAIIRTTVRPDDRMNEYDQEIKKLK